jgi:hypothetical protein
VATPTMARAYALLRRRVDRGRKGNNEEGAGAHDL